MKDGRPGTVLECLAEPRALEAVQTMLFANSSTLGIRTRRCERMVLARRFESVETAFGPVRIKLGGAHGKVVTVAPEYRDVRTAAERYEVSAKQVYQAALAAAHAAGLHVGALWRSAESSI